MTVNEIPLTPTPQKFTISLIGIVYTLLVYWNPQNGWMLDISDSTNNPIVTGIPLVTGCDLLAQYEYLGIGGELVVQTDNDPDAIPTLENLGINSHLYFVTTP